MCEYTKSINLSTSEEWSLPPCSHTLHTEGPQPLPAWSRKAVPEAHGPARGHAPHLHIDVDSIKERTPYLCEEHTSIILKIRVWVLHRFLNTVFQVRIHPWNYYNLYIMQYLPQQHPEGCAPRDPHPTAMSLLSQSQFHPRHWQRENTRRGNSSVWKRRWIKPGSASAVLGTIVGCDTAGRCEAEILPGMAEWAHSAVKGNSLLAIFYSPAQKLQP